MPCSVPGEMQLLVTPFRSNREVQPIPKAVNFSRLHPPHCLAFKCCVSLAAVRVWMLMTKKSKVTKLLDPTVLSMRMYPSCLHAAKCPPCQLAELHPPGMMALQLCTRYICLLAQLKAPKKAVDQDRNSKAVTLRQSLWWDSHRLCANSSKFSASYQKMKQEKILRMGGWKCNMPNAHQHLKYYLI